VNLRNLVCLESLAVSGILKINLQLRDCSKKNCILNIGGIARGKSFLEPFKSILSSKMSIGIVLQFKELGGAFVSF
jgi:hypothetical protein